VAFLDLSDLFIDLDLCDAIYLVRRTSSVDNNGINQIIALPQVTIYGSVQPASGRTLALHPDLSEADGVIEIWTASPAQSATKLLYSDIIEWGGTQYEILQSDDFHNFGGGFYHVVATLYKQTADLPP
jgi:hypothetical protein